VNPLPIASLSGYLTTAALEVEAPAGDPAGGITNSMMYTLIAARARELLVMTAALALVAGLVVLTTAEAGASSNRGQPAPECGREAVQLCHIDITVHQGPPTAGAVCSSFDDGTGFCVGPSRGNSSWTAPSYFPRQGLGASFTWKSQGSVRMVNYEANATFTILEAKIEGRVPSPSSARLDVTDAWNRGSAVHWHTGIAAAPGSPGGPLYIDYEHKVVGSYVHMYGFLERNQGT
jgi:hypothetical protein